jgi:hypothetical protein
MCSPSCSRRLSLSGLFVVGGFGEGGVMRACYKISEIPDTVCEFRGLDHPGRGFRWLHHAAG